MSEYKAFSPTKILNSDMSHQMINQRAFLGDNQDDDDLDVEDSEEFEDDESARNEDEDDLDDEEDKVSESVPYANTQENRTSRL